MRWYQKVCLLATIPVMIAGCAVDLGKLAADMKRPSVTFENPESWSCDQSMKIPTGSFGTVEDCSVCRNRVSTPQRVTIKNSPLDVPAKGAVLLCPTSAKVMAVTHRGDWQDSRPARWKRNPPVLLLSCPSGAGYAEWGRPSAA
jgi:hypothetical protein